MQNNGCVSKRMILKMAFLEYLSGEDDDKWMLGRNFGPRLAWADDFQPMPKWADTKRTFRPQDPLALGL